MEFSGRLDEITRERIGVEVLEIYIRGVESILFLRDKGPCI